MKIQDIGFIIILAILILLRKKILFVWAGLGCFLLAIPFFMKWVFFTGERLTWYGGGFILIFLLIQIFLQPKDLLDNKEV